MSGPHLFPRLALLLSLALGALPACTAGLEQPQSPGGDDHRAAPDDAAPDAPDNGADDDADDVPVPDPADPADPGDGGGGGGDVVDGGEDVDAPPPAPGPTGVCGNGVVEDGEGCDEEHEGCVDCRIPCGFEGGRACGQNGVPSTRVRMASGCRCRCASTAVWRCRRGRPTAAPRRLATRWSPSG